MHQIDRATLKNWLGLQDFILVDIRSQQAWGRSIAKIDHAQRIDSRKLSTLPKNKRIVLYCEDGKTTCPQLAKDLERLGFTRIFVLEGGWLGWSGKDFTKVPKELEQVADHNSFKIIDKTAQPVG